MKLFIPHVGTYLRLIKDWRFTLFFEGRNMSFIKILKPDAKDDWRLGDQSIQATLLIGTILKLDRLYVRKGPASAYDSITISSNIGKKKIRFWVKLDDANNIEFEIVDAKTVEEKPKKKGKVNA